MKGWIAATLIALSGCDILFQLDDVKSIDAAACGKPDEDGDCIADAVDNCPGIKNPSQANDGDADTVGDICDSQPTVSAEMRAEFWPFDDPAQDAAAWPIVNGDWTFEPGYAEHMDTSQLYAGVISAAPQPDGELTVEAGFTFASWSTSAASARLGVWVDMPEGGGDGQMCVFNLYSAGAGDSIHLQERVNQSGLARREEIPALQAGDELVISLRRQRVPELLQCHVLVNGVRYDAPDIAATVAWPQAGHVAVTAGSANAKLRYVVTYVAN